MLDIYNIPKSVSAFLFFFGYKEVVCILEGSLRKVPLYTVGIMKISCLLCCDYRISTARTEVMGVYLPQEISRGRSPRLISQYHNPRTRCRCLSHITALSAISRYTTVFSCCGTPLNCSVALLLPRCHSCVVGRARASPPSRCAEALFYIYI